MPQINATKNSYIQYLLVCNWECWMCCWLIWHLLCAMHHVVVAQNKPHHMYHTPFNMYNSILKMSNTRCFALHKFWGQRYIMRFCHGQRQCLMKFIGNCTIHAIYFSRKHIIYNWPLNGYNSKLKLSNTRCFALYTSSGAKDTYEVLSYPTTMFAIHWHMFTTISTTALLHLTCNKYNVINTVRINWQNNKDLIITDEYCVLMFPIIILTFCHEMLCSWFRRDLTACCYTPLFQKVT